MMFNSFNKALFKNTKSFSSFLASIPSWMISGNRIQGGDDAQAPIPWQVAVRRNGGKNCGGTIIDAKTIVTAAHCIPWQWTQLDVAAGSTNYNQFPQVIFPPHDSIVSSMKHSFQVKQIEAVLFNQEFPYNANRIKYDIALLKLSSPLEFNDDVKPACMPTVEISSIAYSNDDCYISGWGRSSNYDIFNRNVYVMFNYFLFCLGLTAEFESPTELQCL